MRKIQFAEFRLDLELFRLTRDDVPVEIGARALDLLIYLIEHRERVVETDELRERVWQAAALSASSIPTCVRELRIALGDRAGDPRLVQTVRGRGYRFIGTVSGRWVDEERNRRHLAVLPFVGRAEQLSTLRSALVESSQLSSARIVLVRGEAGIGKTRLLTEFLAEAASEARSYLAAAPASDGAPAFWPWTQILREATADVDEAHSELLVNAQYLSSAFPEIQRDADLIRVNPLSLDRHTILSQWARTIRCIAPGKPLVLAFEDIHRSDVDSLALLCWICRELSNAPLLIVATQRRSPASQAVADRLDEIGALPACRTLDLPPLDRHEIAQLLDPLLEERESAGEVLLGQTGGNAFYVTHLIRSLGHRLLSGLSDLSDRQPPPNAQDIVATQLSDLPARTRRALSVASISGKRFTIEVLSEILETPSADVIRDLEPARMGWLVVEDAGGYEFAHALLRDALYETVPSNRRKQLHLAFAAAIGSRSGAYSQTTHIAEHLLQAWPLGDASAAFECSVQAGRESAARFAYALSQSFFARALQIENGASLATAAERINLHLELAESQLYAGDRGASRATVEAAMHLSRQAHLPDLLAECALQLSPDFLSIEFGTSDAVLIRCLEEALEQILEDHKSLRARLLARLSQALQWSGDTARREALANEALRLARESGDQPALAAALSARAETMHGPDTTQARIRILKELGHSQRSTASFAQVLVQRTRLIASLLELGDVQRLEAENEMCRQLADATQLPQLLWYPESMDSMRSLMRGDLEANQERLARRHDAIVQRGLDVNVVQGFATQAIFRLIERDRLDQALEAIRPLAASYPAVRSWTAGVAWIQFLGGSRHDCARTLESFDEETITAVFKEAGAGVALAMLAEVVAGIGARGQALALYRQLRPVADRCAVAGYGVLYMGRFSRYCGLLAGALGRLDRAVEHLEDAIEHERRADARAWHGYAQIDLALHLHRRDRSDARVAEALFDAAETCERVATPRLRRRMRDAVREIGAGTRASK